MPNFFDSKLSHSLPDRKQKSNKMPAIQSKPTTVINDGPYGDGDGVWDMAKRLERRCTEASVDTMLFRRLYHAKTGTIEVELTADKFAQKALAKDTYRTMRDRLGHPVCNRDVETVLQLLQIKISSAKVPGQKGSLSHYLDTS